MIELIATAESVGQAEQLLAAGADTLYIGEDAFGLRLPASFTKDDIEKTIGMAHKHGKKVCVAVNAIFHNDRIQQVLPYLSFLQEAGADFITVGDAGVVHLMKRGGISLPFIYDAQTLVTNAKQIEFWVKRGAVGAVLARELTFDEIRSIRNRVSVPLEVLVYGASCIHHSKRPLVTNYFRFTNRERPDNKGLFISEQGDPESHYSIYEDINGTHIFATDDVNLMSYLGQLRENGLSRWKMDGIFTRGGTFVEIVRLFAEAKQSITEGSWSQETAERLNVRLLKLHPEERTASAGFFVRSPTEVQ